ncbi:MAG: hypothetical protein R3C42_09590 [Parvularculaceae bacterium]|nr:hypothetical protein [Parvularculaceae bacterium]
MAKLGTSQCLTRDGLVKAVKLRNSINGEIAAKLQNLVEYERSPNSSDKDWESRCEEFVKFVRAMEATHLIDEEIWHYTSDLKIRRKDPNYSAAQVDYVFSYIEKFEKYSQEE